MKSITAFFTSSIQRKIIFSFGITIVIIGVIVLTALFQLLQIRNSTRKVGPATLQIELLQDFALSLSAVEADLERFLAFRSGETQALTQQDLETLLGLFGIIADFEEDAGSEALAELGRLVPSLEADVQFLLRAEADNLTSSEINDSTVAFYSGIEQIKQLHQDLLIGKRNQLQTISQQQETIVDTVLLQFLALGLASFLIVFISSWVLARLITRPIIDLTATAIRISSGDLEAQATVQFEDEIGDLAVAFNNMAQQQQSLIISLSERARNLELVTVLNEQLNAILSPDQLLSQFVVQVKETFGYYHVRVYLLDDSGQQLVLRAESGSRGETDPSISLWASDSPVTQAARNNEMVQIDNVREIAGWQPEPHLPDAYAEIVIPVSLDEQVVGVIDVLQDEIAGLSEGDFNRLRLLTNHVAISLRNARQFELIEAALIESETIRTQYVEQSWDKTRITQQATANIELRLDTAADEKDGQPDLVVPIKLLDTTIGDLQLESNHAHQTWTDSELALINAVVDQVAQTAENLRLFEETRDLASREQLIGQISNRLRRVPDMEALMKAAVGELSRVLGSDRAFIRFGSEADLGVVAPVNGPAETEAGGQDAPEAAAESDDDLKRNGS